MKLDVYVNTNVHLSKPVAETELIKFSFLNLASKTCTVIGCAMNKSFLQRESIELQTN